MYEQICTVQYIKDLSRIIIYESQWILVFLTGVDAVQQYNYEIWDVALGNIVLLYSVL